MWGVLVFNGYLTPENAVLVSMICFILFLLIDLVTYVKVNLTVDVIAFTW